MKQFKLTIALLLLFLVIIVLAGIYEFNKEINPPTNSNIITDQVVDVTQPISTSTDIIGTSTAKVSPKPDPSKIKITDKSWTWVKTVYNDGKVVDSKIKDAFEITFIQDGRFSAKTDCNSIGGEYTFTENKITLDKMVSTLMYCDQSQESEFAKMLGEVDNFLFSKNGELVLGLKFDSGSIILR